MPCTESTQEHKPFMLLQDTVSQCSYSIFHVWFINAVFPSNHNRKTYLPFWERVKIAQEPLPLCFYSPLYRAFLLTLSKVAPSISASHTLQACKLNAAYDNMSCLARHSGPPGRILSGGTNFLWGLSQRGGGETAQERVMRKLNRCFLEPSPSRLLSEVSMKSPRYTLLHNIGS